MCRSSARGLTCRSKNDSNSEAAEQKQAEQADRLKQGNGTSAMRAISSRNSISNNRCNRRRRPVLPRRPRSRLSDRQVATPTGPPNARSRNGAGAMTQGAPRGPGSNALQPESDARTSAAQQKQAQQTERLNQGSRTAIAPNANQQPMQAPMQPPIAAAQKPEQAQPQHAPTAPKQNGTSEDKRKDQNDHKEPKP